MIKNSIFSEILSQKKGVIEAHGDGDMPYFYAIVPIIRWI